MINEKIKKLIYILLLFIIIYLFLLISPRISKIFMFCFKIILPFLIAFVFAFILHPLVNFIQKYFKKRIIAVILVLVIAFIILFLFSKYIVSTLIYELDLLIIKLPEIFKQLEEVINQIISKIPIFNNAEISLEDLINQNYNNVQNNIFSNETLNKILSAGKYIIITPVVLLYLLLDYDKILNKIKNYLIENNYIKFKSYLGELNKTMSSYFRGVLFVMLILFMVFTIAFAILKVENGMIFALIIAVTNIIPYIGSWIGTALPVIYVLISSNQKAIIVLIVCIIIQIIEANILTPLVQGKKIKLHPLFIILSVIIFGSLFGFFGMLIAVPMCAFINITLKYYPLNIIFKKNKLE